MQYNLGHDFDNKDKENGGKPIGLIKFSNALFG